MTKNKALLAVLQARPGKEAALADLLRSARALAADEPRTLTWYAVQIDARSFAIFDTFEDEVGRTAHLEGRIAQALVARADELLASPLDIKKLDVIASK